MLRIQSCRSKITKQNKDKGTKSFFQFARRDTVKFGLTVFDAVMIVEFKKTVTFDCLSLVNLFFLL